MTAPVPMWGERRNADWHGMTLRECPDLLPTWAPAPAPFRVRLRRLWAITETTLAVCGWLMLIAFVAVGLTY